MSWGIGRKLRKLKLEIVPGYPITPVDLILFRQKILGTAAPFNLYGRWRKLLGPLVPENYFEEAGLENMKEIYPGKFDRQIMVIQSLRNVLNGNGEGVVAEFGSFRGHTAIQIAQAMKAAGDRSKFYLFDSFEGFPASDRPEDVFWKKGDLASNVDEVRKRFSSFENVVIVKGFFKDTLPLQKDIQIKFAHVDADLYSSIREVNKWILDRMIPGGTIVYDDYGFDNCIGAKNAVDEAMEGRSDFLKFYLPTGQYLAIKK